MRRNGTLQRLCESLVFTMGLLNASGASAARLAFDIVDSYVHASAYAPLLGQPVTARVEFDPTDAVDIYSVPGDPNNATYLVPMTVTFRTGPVQFVAKGTGTFLIYNNRDGEDVMGWAMAVDTVVGPPALPDTLWLGVWDFGIDMPVDTLKSDHVPTPAEFLALGRQPGGGGLNFERLNPTGPGGHIGFAYGYMQPVDLVQEGFEKLISMSAAVGPGRSLAAKVSRAWANYSAGAVSSSCGTLNAFTQEVIAQRGKSISAETADRLLSEAQALAGDLECR